MPYKIALVSLLTLGLLLSAGCRQKAAVNTAGVDEPPATEPASQPASEPANDDDTAASEVIVKAKFEQVRESYQSDEKAKAGHFRGACRFAGSASFHDSRLQLKDIPIELTGPNAIQDPQPGEVEYYTNCKPAQPRHISTLGDSFAPAKVVAIVHGVKAGKRSPLGRPVLIIKEGAIKTGAEEQNRSHQNIQFCPVHERIQFFTWDNYPCDIVLTHAATGKVAFQTRMLKPKEEAKNFALNENLMVQSPVIDTPGLYTVTCKRHPWQKAYVFVVDSPYVQVSYNYGHGPSPIFLLDSIPPGNYRLQLWHELYKPVQEMIDIEVNHDQTTEMTLDFVCPEEFLKKAPEKPVPPAKK